MSLQNFLLVGLGGFFGSMSRFGLSRLIDEGLLTKNFPYATFTINILGSFLLGVVYALALKKIGNAEAISYLLGIGFCGGFTTFSTFAWENMALIEQRNFSGLLLYSGGSIVLALIAVWGGFTIVKSLI
jgi:CrcB protein